MAPDVKIPENLAQQILAAAASSPQSRTTEPDIPCQAQVRFVRDGTDLFLELSCQGNCPPGHGCQPSFTLGDDDAVYFGCLCAADS